MMGRGGQGTTRQTRRPHLSPRETVKLRRERVTFCARFDRKHGAGSAERFLALLTADECPFQLIGNRYGISRQRVQQIHRRFVEPVTGKSGRDRRLAHRLTVPHVTYPAPVRRVVDAALGAGCTVSHVTERYPSGSPITRRVQLLVNGVRCKIRRACPHRVGAEYHYDKAVVTLAGLRHAAVHVFVAERLYVVPTEDLRAVLFRHPHRRRACVYLPHGAMLEGSQGSLPWASYVDAWPGREKRRRAA
jgi:hypothetical protein